MKRIATLLLLVFAGPTLAQQVGPFERGTQAYRAVLNRCGLKPLEMVQEALAEPSHSMIVMFGQIDIYDSQFANNRLKEFIRKGGAVLFATDQPTLGEMWLQLEVSVNGTIVEASPDDTNVIYRDEFIECPILQQPQRLRMQSKLNLLGTLQVATNRPSFLNRLPMPGEPLFGQGAKPPELNQARVIAELPTDCHPPFGRVGFQVPQNRFLFAIAASHGQGRYAVLADHSMFLNMMMLQNDNDNIAFAMKLTRWLSNDGMRTRVLFVDDGQVRQDFNLNIDYIDPPLPHPDVLGPMVDQLMGSLERDDLFNRGIQRLMPPFRILRAALLLLTGMAAVFFLVRMTNRRYRMDRAVARLPDRLSDLVTPSAPEVVPTPASVGVAARELARGMLERLLDGPIDTKHPPITTGSGAWVARVRTIWETAIGKAGRITRPAELERLARDLIDLQRAVERGDVRLAMGANA